MLLIVIQFLLGVYLVKHKPLWNTATLCLEVFNEFSISSVLVLLVTVPRSSGPAQHILGAICTVVILATFIVNFGFCLFRLVLDLRLGCKRFLRLILTPVDAPA